LRHDLTRPVCVTAAFAVALRPSPALAHAAIPGVTGFPALMLHPLVVPEQALLLIAGALVAGRMPTTAFASAVFAFIAGLLAGKGAHLMIAWLSMFWYAPLVLALLAGIAVAAFGRIAPLTGVASIFALSFVFSVGIVPDEPTLTGLLKAVGAAGVTGIVLFGLAGLPLTRVTSHWGGVLIRVGGAWISAIALINLALAFAPMAQSG
jgi:hypothetical protein